MTTQPIIETSRQSILRYIYNLLLLVFDISVNVIIIGFIRLFIKLPAASGNAHFSTSQALDEMRSASIKPACTICNVLSILFKPFHWKTKNYDHCASSMQGMPTDIEVS